MRKIDSLAK